MAFKKSKLIKTILRDKDKRGSIISVVNEKCSNVSIISCFKNYRYPCGKTIFFVID